jgi:CheY-like chemotaxis protein
MRVLVLDDNPERHKAFRRNLFNHTVVHVETYHDAVQALAMTPRFDVVFLDHDLNEFGAKSVAESTMYGFGGSVELTGDDLCRFIVNQLPEERHPQIAVIHSLNHWGAKNMESRLVQTNIQVVVRPFSTDITIVLATEDK